jgi:hypothetical protein
MRRRDTQQQGAVTANDQREMAGVQDRRDRISNTGNQRAEAIRIDDVGPGVTRAGDGPGNVTLP